MTDVLSMLEPLLVGCLPESPPRAVKQGQGYGALWKPEHTVHGMLALWPQIQRYSQEQRLSVDLPALGRVSAWIVGDPSPEPRGLVLQVGFKFDGGPEERRSHVIPWPDEFSRKLLMGEPVSYQQYQFQIERGFRMPSIMSHKGKVRIQFPTIRIQRRGLLGWLLHARVGGLTADATGADVELLGLRGRLVSPRLVWA
jgi:hypothetical protein